MSRSLAQQGFGGALVARPAVAFQSEQRQIVLGARIALLGGFAEPFRRFVDVAIDALARKAHQPERHLRSGIALLGSLLVPDGGGRKIRLHPVTVGVEDAESEFGSAAALGSGERVPVASFLIIALAADPARVNQPGIGLCVGEPLLGSRPAPAQCLGRILWDVEPVRKEKRSIVVGGLGVVLGGGTIPSRKARRMGAVAVEMHQAELMLRHRMALLCRAPVPAGGIGEVGDNAMPTGIEQSQPIPGFGVSGGSRRGPFLEGCNVIATFIRLMAALHGRSGPALPGIEPGDPASPCLPRPYPSPAGGGGKGGGGSRGQRRRGQLLHTHGSRIASLTLRITPFSTYMKTECDPTLISAVRVMPGTSLKLSGTAWSLTSVNAMRAL